MHRFLWWVALGGCGGADLVALELAADQDTLGPGEVAALVATAVYGDDAREDVTAEAEWSTDDEAVATVDGGEVLAVAPGLVVVDAAFEGLTASLELSVVDAGPFDVTVRGDWAPQHGNQGLAFYARVVDDADGSVVTCGSVVDEDAVWEIATAGVLLAGHTYHAEAFADVNGDGLQNDAGHAYFSDAKRPAAGAQSFEVPHAGAAPAWEGEACPSEAATAR